ncbi:MAG: PLP-dependent aminotransferase family protein [Myxococcales bacterium]|nr:PLP-dependent aminotransferase family protein [Myxococcales bacterium]
MAEWQPQITERAGPRYMAIADAIADAIAGGQLAPGDRLPTHRELADILGVTVGTVTRGYAEASRRGITVGEVGRGTFVKPSSATFEAWSEHADPTRRRPGVINLHHSVMICDAADESTRLSKALGDLSREGHLASLISDYSVVDGLPEHREAGADWLRPRLPEATPDRLLLTSGAQHAMVATLSAVARPGDVVLTESLTYPGIKAAAQMLGLTLRGIPIDEEGVMPDALQRAVQTHLPAAVYLVPTIHNPTTRTMPLQRRIEIARVLESSDAVLLEDDAHGLLDEDAPPPVATWLADQTVFLATTSKVLAPGLRVGFAHAPQRLLQRIRAAIRGTVWMPPPLMVEVVTRWIRDGTAAELLTIRRQEAAARQAMATEAFADHSLWQHPHSYYVWLFLPEPWRREDFVRSAEDRGVRIVGAEAFAIGRHDVPHAVRIGIGTVPQRRTLRRALQILSELLADGGGPCCGVV